MVVCVTEEKTMALEIHKHCPCCNKHNRLFSNAQPGPHQEVCDECLEQIEEKRKSERLIQLRILAQNWEMLADYLLGLEEKVQRLESGQTAQ